MHAIFGSLFAAVKTRCVRRGAFGAMAIASLLMAQSAGAAIIGTYVDADPTGGSPNTTPASAFPTSFTYSDSFSDGLWDVRTGFGLDSTGAPGTSSAQTILEAGPSTTETDPAIITTVSGLAAGTYAVSVLYWSNAEDWTVRAKMSTDSTYLEYGKTGSTSSINGVDTLISEAGGALKLYQAVIGTVTGTGFSVNLLNSTQNLERTWYDGVAYTAIATPEPSSLVLSLFAGVASALIYLRRRKCN